MAFRKAEAKAVCAGRLTWRNGVEISWRAWANRDESTLAHSRSRSSTSSGFSSSVVVRCATRALIRDNTNGQLEADKKNTMRDVHFVNSLMAIWIEEAAGPINRVSSDARAVMDPDADADGYECSWMNFGPNEYPVDAGCSCAHEATDAELGDLPSRAT